MNGNSEALAALRSREIAQGLNGDVVQASSDSCLPIRFADPGLERWRQSLLMREKTNRLNESRREILGLDVDGQNYSAIVSAARDMMGRPEEEAGSVILMTKSYLITYRDYVVASNVSRSDFCIRGLMLHNSTVSLYILTQPNDKVRLRPLACVMVYMIVRLLAGKMVFENWRSVVH